MRNDHKVLFGCRTFTAIAALFLVGCLGGCSKQSELDAAWDAWDKSEQELHQAKQREVELTEELEQAHLEIERLQRQLEARDEHTGSLEQREVEVE